ncbi:hypothetical protein LSPCS325_43710 [Lysinibacillus sp. CTST325]
MSQSSAEIIIRNFEHGDMPLLGDLYRSVAAKENATFWWVGDEDNWSNVFVYLKMGKWLLRDKLAS